MGTMGTKNLEFVLKKQWNCDPFTPFGAVVEPNLPGAFITVDPLDSFRSGNFSKVPVIIGVTEDEGILLHSAGK